MFDSDDRRLWPVPREVTWGEGLLRLGSPPCCIVGHADSYAAEVLARRLQAPVRDTHPGGCVPMTLLTDPEADFARGLGRDQRPEAYRLTVDEAGIAILAAGPDGLLRGAATLLQLLRDEHGDVTAPFVTVTDFPAFRFRCASDWLLNVEANRWGYDWGDGLDAFRDRVERKLDLCFEHKINQVWFDGFGWDVDRFPGYAELMRHCTSYARRRGIRLTCAGYGGGYGTSYQTSELYRCGYQGQVFINRRPYPDGPEYLCCGLPEAPESRRYGTCPSNEALQTAKLGEMARFVAAVQPGFMYIHDIDTGIFRDAHEAWLARCDECRRRRPSDEMTDPQGQAGAMAAWFRRIREDLSAVPAEGDYQPERDLTTVFVSPVYTDLHEPGQPDVWEREVEYFGLLSSLVGPVGNVQFGIREQFLHPSGEARVAQLRRALDDAGCGHGILVCTFGGGDNYVSDELTNQCGVLSSMQEGAESVYLANGGVHEEPVQLLNAEWLWNGRASSLAEHPRDAAEADALFEAIRKGEHRPPSVFAEGGALHSACCRLWGDDAGLHMYRAYLSGRAARSPVTRVWWAITREVRRLKGDTVEHGWTWEELRERWQARIEATREAGGHAQAALSVDPHPDIEWFVRCLQIGERFARVVLQSVELRLEDSPENRARLAATLDDLQEYITREFDLEFTDILGGDPGCWQETVDALRDVMLTP